jgi:hypothetical protein
MIAEVFLTPHVFFDNGSNAIQRLRDLKEALFPRKGAAPIVVTNLTRVEWVRETSRMILTNQNHDVKELALDLFTKIEADILVNRSMPAGVAPKSESDWLVQAERTHSEFPLSLAVNCEPLNGMEVNGLNIVDDCNSDVLNECLKNPRRIERTTKAQDPLLKSLCGHAQWMIIQFPFVRGIDDEYETLGQIFQIVETRANWMPRCEIEIQINPKHAKAIETIKRQLHERHCTKSKHLVRLASHEFSDRTILAGDFISRDRRPVKIARWLVQPGHPAVRFNQDKRSDLETTWSFFGRKEATEMLEKLTR